jgi:hypothetical protein
MNTTRPTISARREQPKPDIAYMPELWRTGQVADGVAKAVEEREARCTRKIGEIAGHIRARCLVDTGHTLRDRVATTTVIRPHRAALRPQRQRRRDARDVDRYAT